MGWRRLAALALVALVALSLPGCKAGTQDEKESPTVEKENVTVDNTGLDGFYTMMVQPNLTQEAHPLSDVTKILCFEDQNMLSLYTFAIDIAGKGMFIDPRPSLSLDYDEPDCRITDADADEVLAILERNDVLAWDPVYGKMTDYGEDAVDGGGGWYLFLQYSDNTVSRFHGMKEYPDTYDSFIRELMDFADSRNIMYAL